MWYEIKDWWRIHKERLALGIARRLPRWLVYWATIRCIAYATSGQWGEEEVPATLAMDVLKRWEK